MSSPSKRPRRPLPTTSMSGRADLPDLPPPCAPPARRGPDPIAVVLNAKALTRAAIARDRAAKPRLTGTRATRRRN